MSRTVARPVFGFGWGRCTTILSLPSRSPIRDPERSTISTPQARSMASSSRHRMSDGVGIAKTRSSTLRCLVLTTEGIGMLVLIQVPFVTPLAARLGNPTCPTGVEPPDNLTPACRKQGLMVDHQPLENASPTPRRYTLRSCVSVQCQISRQPNS